MSSLASGLRSTRMLRECGACCGAVWERVRASGCNPEKSQAMTRPSVLLRAFAAAIFLSAALLFKTSGVDAQAVPFDGGAPALTAVLGNQVDFASIQVGEAIENVQSGQLTPLAVFGPDRIEYLPDVPTA